MCNSRVRIVKQRQYHKIGEVYRYIKTLHKEDEPQFRKQF